MARHKFIEGSVAAESGSQGQVIPLLQTVQEKLSYVPEDAIREISDITSAAVSDIYSVVTFYKQFRLRAPGKYLVRLCDGTACHVNDSKTLLDVITDELKLDSSDTTDDGLFTVETVACLGCCSIGPVIMVNEEVHGKLTPKVVKRLLKEYQNKGKGD